MKSVYEECPVLENERFKLRLISKDDAKDLFRVYGDQKNVPFFNADNCHGNGFYCSKLEYVEESIKYWLMEYEGKGFVRWSIIDKNAERVIGTIELFHRDSKDYFNNCGLLRLDVASDYEKRAELEEILSIINQYAYTLFECDVLATKAAPYATERRQALMNTGYNITEEKLVGNDGTEYDNYWIRSKTV